MNRISPTNKKNKNGIAEVATSETSLTLSMLLLTSRRCVCVALCSTRWSQIRTVDLLSYIRCWSSIWVHVYPWRRMYISL